MIFIEFHQLLYSFRGEEVVLALDFVRDMDEEELQHILDQAEVRLNRGVIHLSYNQLNFSRLLA